MNDEFVITAMSRDRVGIVAEVAGAISTLQGNISELSQTVLHGYFTMILLAAFPTEVTAEMIQARLAAIENPGAPPLKISVLPIAQADGVAQQPTPADIYVLTASGADRIGFVAAVATFCAENAMNILDLATVVEDGRYIMMLQVDLSRCAPLATIQKRLRTFAAANAIHMDLQHNDIFEATHAINMPL